MKEYKVELDGERLDKVIASLDKEISRAMVQKLLFDGKVSVNNSIQKSSYKVKVGDIIKIEEIEVKETKLIPQKIDLDIVYEDKDIIVVNKPKGLVVHPREW